MNRNFLFLQRLPFYPHSPCSRHLIERTRSPQPRPRNHIATCEQIAKCGAIEISHVSNPVMPPSVSKHLAARLPRSGVTITTTPPGRHVASTSSHKTYRVADVLYHVDCSDYNCLTTLCGGFGNKRNSSHCNYIMQRSIIGPLSTRQWIEV